MPIAANTDNRLIWIDNLKALAIFLVVLGHTGLDEQTAAYGSLVEWIYLFHMPLFFMLSGFSFSVLINRGKKSVLNQFCNLILIYFLQSIIYIVFNSLVHSFLNIQTYNVTDFKDIFLMVINPVAHFWYLHVLIIIYAIEIMLRKLIKDNRLRFVIVVIISCIGICTGFGSLSRAMYELLYFECGTQILKLKKIPWQISLIGLLASFAIPFISIHNIYFARIIVVGIALSISFFCVNLFSKHMDTNIRFVTSSGKNCLWIYVFHTYFTALSRNICSKIMPMLPEVSVIIVTIVGLIGPVIIMFILQKIKIDKIVRKPIAFLWK